MANEFRSIRNDAAHTVAHNHALAQLGFGPGSDSLVQAGFRADADTDVFSLYLAKELEQVSAETLDVLRFPLMGRQVMPFTNELDPGAESWSYDMYNVAGQADWITNWSTPVGGQSAGKRRFNAKAYHFGSHYQYTVMDLERAAFAKSKNASNRSLDVEVARSARLAHEQFLDKLVWDGNSARGIVGLPGIQVALGATIGDFDDIVTTAGSEVQVTYLRPTHKLYTSAAFSGDGPKVVQALNELCLAIMRNTGGATVANRLLLPLKFKSIMIQPYSNSILDGKTIESVFLQNQPPNGVKQIDYVYNLDDKSAVSQSPGGRAIAMFASPQTVRFVLAYDFKEMPAQIKEMAYHIPTYAYVLGPVCQRPLNFAQMDLDNETNA